MISVWESVKVFSTFVGGYYYRLSLVGLYHRVDYVEKPLTTVVDVAILIVSANLTVASTLFKFTVSASYVWNTLTMGDIRISTCAPAGTMAAQVS